MLTADSATTFEYAAEKLGDLDIQLGVEEITGVGIGFLAHFSVDRQRFFAVKCTGDVPGGQRSAGDDGCKRRFLLACLAFDAGGKTQIGKLGHVFAAVCGDLDLIILVGCGIFDLEFLPLMAIGEGDARLAVDCSIGLAVGRAVERPRFGVTPFLVVCRSDVVEGGGFGSIQREGNPYGGGGRGLLLGEELGARAGVEELALAFGGVEVLVSANGGAHYPIGELAVQFSDDGGGFHVVVIAVVRFGGCGHLVGCLEGGGEQHAVGDGLFACKGGEVYQRQRSASQQNGKSQRNELFGSFHEHKPFME